MISKMTNDQLDQALQESIALENEVAVNALFEERKKRIQKAQAKLRMANMTEMEARKKARQMAEAYLRDARPSLPPSQITRVQLLGTRAAVEIKTLSTGHNRIILIRFSCDKYGEKVSHRGGKLAQAREFLEKAQ